MNDTSGFDRSLFLSTSESAFLGELNATVRKAFGDRRPNQMNDHSSSSRATLDQLARLGLIELLFSGPPDVGAAMRICLLRQVLARYSEHAETTLALQGLGTYPLIQAGSKVQLARWLDAVKSGEAMAAFALTEPGAGSDLASLQLTASPRAEGGWTLNGVKKWISNAPDADFYTVFARTSDGVGTRGISAFLVPARAPGLTGSTLQMVSAHSLGELTFEGVQVSPDQLLGVEGQGIKIAMGTLNLFRPSVGAFGVGMAEAAFDLARSWVQERRIYDGRLSDLDSVRITLATMRVRIDAAQLLVYRAARGLDAGLPDITCREFVAAAKVAGTETAQWAIDQAIQLHGACALQSGHRLEGLYREVRGTRIYEGATEVQYATIGKSLLTDDA